MYVRDHMSAPPVVVRESVSLAEARETLRRGSFRHLPVVDGEGRLVGILSDRDLRGYLPTGLDSEEQRRLGLERLEAVTVGQVMTGAPASLPLHGTIDDALWIFESLKVGALPVVDDGERVVGVFSVPDLMAAYRTLFGVGEAGTAFLEIEDDGSADIVSRLATVLEGRGVGLKRMIRSGKGIFLRLETYNIHGLCGALGEAGLKCRVEEGKKRK